MENLANLRDNLIHRTHTLARLRHSNALQPVIDQMKEGIEALKKKMPLDLVNETRVVYATGKIYELDCGLHILKAKNGMILQLTPIDCPLEKLTKTQHEKWGDFAIGIEELVFQHVIAGIDISTPDYQEKIKETIAGFNPDKKPVLSINILRVFDALKRGRLNINTEQKTRLSRCLYALEMMGEHFLPQGDIPPGKDPKLDLSQYDPYEAAFIITLESLVQRVARPS